METQHRALPFPLPRAPGARRIPRAAIPLAVRGIDDARHLGFLLEKARPESISFLQCPAWGRVKTAWRAESVGWFCGHQLVGTALVLHRDLPAFPLLGRRSLAYIPEGPTVDWFGSGRTAADWLDPLFAHLRAAGVFDVKMGPKVIGRTWPARAVKTGMADPAYSEFSALPADPTSIEAHRLVEQLRSLGWRRRDRGEQGIADTQPRHFVRLPLRGRDSADLFADLSPQWRRNIRIAERGGVKVWRASAADLPTFHAMYLETARRDRFLPRPLAYFQQMFRELLAADPGSVRLYLAGADGVAAAGATMVRLGGHAWFAYGASTTERREQRASNALQWRMMRDCLVEGMDVYDIRGVAETLDPDHPMFGLLRFKVGTGGEVVEYPGEYDYALSRPLALAVRMYLRHR